MLRNTHGRPLGAATTRAGAPRSPSPQRGEVVLLDWAFVGDGALGEDIGNLVRASVLDLLLAHELLDQLDERLTSAYLDGLREAALGR